MVHWIAWQYLSLLGYLWVESVWFTKFNVYYEVILFQLWKWVFITKIMYKIKFTYHSHYKVEKSGSKSVSLLSLSKSLISCCVKYCLFIVLQHFIELSIHFWVLAHLGASIRRLGFCFSIIAIMTSLIISSQIFFLIPFFMKIHVKC